MNSQTIHECEERAHRVADELRAVREERNMTRNALAQRSGLHHSTISMIEDYEIMPTIFTLYRICEVLHVDLARVIRRAQQKKE